MPHSKIQVVVDDRELKSKVATFLDQMDNTVVTIRRLAVGDYLVNNLLLFERKTLTDFAASIKDGRLFIQARRMAASRFKGVFILEGKTGDLLDSRMSREAIQGALITLSLVFGIPLLRAVDISESVEPGCMLPTRGCNPLFRDPLLRFRVCSPLLCHVTRT